jgi:hypothetical protein
VEAEEEFGAPEVGQMGSVLEGEVDVVGAGESHVEGWVDLAEAVTEPLGDEEGDVLLGDLGDADGAWVTASMPRVDEEPVERREGASRDLGTGAAERVCRRGGRQRCGCGGRQEERCEGCDGASGS